MAIKQDPLFLGATRPAQLFGTHWGALIANVIITMYSFVLSDVLWYLLICIPIHAVCVAISAYDPNAFRLIGLALQTRFASIANAFYWRASSANPFSKRRY